MQGSSHISKVLAITFVVASTFVSCRNSQDSSDGIDFNVTPMQTVHDMFATQSENGILQLRMEAPLMEHYETDSLDYDSFPEGIAVFAYTEEGLLESIVVADKAMHRVPKTKSKKKQKDADDEVWEAFGNVLLHNVINRQTLETDTLYWDRSAQEVYTDCYVKLYSPDGFMQGYGMRSDDRMTNARLNRNFNSYVYVQRDSTEVMIDSVNFIGPFPK